jgi:uncharacterized membrane protein YkvI
MYALEFKRDSWSDGLRIAMAYIGTVIGAGFASGQEILQFFTKYGYWSYCAILLSTLIFILAGHRILKLGSSLKAGSFRGLTRNIFGAAAPAVDIYLGTSFILLLGAMFAGAGALFSEHWGLPFYLGAVFTAVASLVVTLYGVKGILSANFFLVPLIILFNLLVFLFVFGQRHQPALDLRLAPTGIYPLLKAGITYASFNVVLSIGVLVPMGGTIRDSKAIFLGSFLGGGLLGLMLIVCNYSLLHYLPEVFHREIPLLYIVDLIGKTQVFIFGIIIWLGIFTTAIGNLFSFVTLGMELFKVKTAAISLATVVIALIICSLGFSNIVSYFYPLLGIMGFILIGIIVINKK